MKEIINLQGIEMYAQDLAELYQLGQVIFFKYKKVFVLKWNNNSRCYLLEEMKYLRLMKSEKPYTLRGKFIHTADYNFANRLIGREVFNNFQA